MVCSKELVFSNIFLVLLFYTSISQTTIDIQSRSHGGGMEGHCPTRNLENPRILEKRRTAALDLTEFLLRKKSILACSCFE